MRGDLVQVGCLAVHEIIRPEKTFGTNLEIDWGFFHSDLQLPSVHCS